MIAIVVLGLLAITFMLTIVMIDSLQTIYQRLTMRSAIIVVFLSVSSIVIYASYFTLVVGVS